MATYKVPQDVEADDKLLGPLTFRQFVYMMITFGLIMLAVALFQLYPLLAIIPVPLILFFGILALPIKKDQPMETYLAALWSFYTKPNKRYWMTGQSNSTIQITAPKKVEAPRARNISSDEAGHRLSFLADLVDSEGQSIKTASTPMKDEFYAEAYNTTDMFDKNDSYNLNRMIDQQQDEHRAAVVAEMRFAIAQSNYNYDKPATPAQPSSQRVIQPHTATANPSSPQFTSPVIVQPTVTPPASTTSAPTRPIENVQQQADRIRRENESEVYISLH